MVLMSDGQGGSIFNRMSSGDQPQESQGVEDASFSSGDLEELKGRVSALEEKLGKLEQVHKDSIGKTDKAVQMMEEDNQGLRSLLERSAETADSKLAALRKDILSELDKTIANFKLQAKEDYNRAEARVAAFAEGLTGLKSTVLDAQSKAGDLIVKSGLVENNIQLLEDSVDELKKRIGSLFEDNAKKINEIDDVLTAKLLRLESDAAEKQKVMAEAQAKLLQLENGLGMRMEAAIKNAGMALDNTQKRAEHLFSDAMKRLENLERELREKTKDYHDIYGRITQVENGVGLRLDSALQSLNAVIAELRGRMDGVVASFGDKINSLNAEVGEKYKGIGEMHGKLIQFESNYGVRIDALSHSFSKIEEGVSVLGREVSVDFRDKMREIEGRLSSVGFVLSRLEQIDGRLDKVREESAVNNAAVKETIFAFQNKAQELTWMPNQVKQLQLQFSDFLFKLAVFQNRIDQVDITAKTLSNDTRRLSDERKNLIDCLRDQVSRSADLLSRLEAASGDEQLENSADSGAEQ